MQLGRCVFKGNKATTPILKAVNNKIAFGWLNKNKEVISVIEAHQLIGSAPCKRFLIGKRSPHLLNKHALLKPASHSPGGQQAHLRAALAE